MTPKEKALNYLKQSKLINQDLIVVQDKIGNFYDYYYARKVFKAIDIALEEQAKEIFGDIKLLNPQGVEMGMSLFEFNKLKKKYGVKE